MITLENVINAKGYDLLKERKLKEAVEIFKLNVLAFPQSANAFDSLGEAYLEAGDKKSAIDNYSGVWYSIPKTRMHGRC